MLRFYKFMDPAVLITKLVALQGSTHDARCTEVRALVIDLQDCLLRMQRENLELRRENVQLRQHLAEVPGGARNHVVRIASLLKPA